MKQKTVLIIPGSAWQVPLIRYCKKQGYRTLTVNPYENSAGFQEADGYLQADMFDEEKVMAYCRENHADALLSEECDIAMPAVAKYGTALGLPVLSRQAACLFTDKYAMREFCRKNNFPCPQYRMCKTVEEALDFYRNEQIRMIMKPLDSNSSRGVFTIEKEEDIAKHFAESLSFSKIEHAVLLERYIEGVEFTVDGIKTPHGHTSLAISEKRHFKHNKNIASELYFTYDNEKFDYDLLRKTNDAFVNASDLQFGLTHAEYKYENGKFYLIEIAARGGGNLISAVIVPFLSGIDNYRYLLDCSLGNITSPDFTVKKEQQKKAAVLKFFETPADGGIVKAVESEELLKKNPAVVQYQFNFKIGDHIEKAKNDAARVGFYIACCESKEELDSLMEQIDRKIRIVLL